MWRFLLFKDDSKTLPFSLNPQTLIKLRDDRWVNLNNTRAFAFTVTSYSSNSPLTLWNSWFRDMLVILILLRNTCEFEAGRGRQYFSTTSSWELFLLWKKSLLLYVYTKFYGSSDFGLTFIFTYFLFICVHLENFTLASRSLVHSIFGLVEHFEVTFAVHVYI